MVCFVALFLRNIFCVSWLESSWEMKPDHQVCMFQIVHRFLYCLAVCCHTRTHKFGFMKSFCYEGCRVFVEKIKDRQTLKCARFSTFELSSCCRLMGSICRIQMQRTFRKYCLFVLSVVFFVYPKTSRSEPEVTWISDAWLILFVNTCWDSCSARRYKVQWKYDTTFEIKLSTYLFLYVPYIESTGYSSLLVFLLILSNGFSRCLGTTRHVLDKYVFVWLMYCII